MAENTKKNFENDWENVYQRMEQEGFHYCFKHYSDFKDVIEDKKFHQLREKYLSSANELETYITDKYKDYIFNG